MVHSKRASASNHRDWYETASWLPAKKDWKPNDMPTAITLLFLIKSVEMLLSSSYSNLIS